MNKMNPNVDIFIFFYYLFFFTFLASCTVLPEFNILMTHQQCIKKNQSLNLSFPTSLFLSLQLSSIFLCLIRRFEGNCICLFKAICRCLEQQKKKKKAPPSLCVGGGSMRNKIEYFFLTASSGAQRITNAIEK